MRTRTIATIVIFGVALFGQTHADVEGIEVKVIQQENPFASAEERERFFQQISGPQMLRFNFSDEEKSVIVDFINYQLPGPSTASTRAWVNSPLWGGTISQIQTLLVERAKPAKAIFWSGKINYSVLGPASFIGDIVPKTFRNKTPGDYWINYISGGPPNSSFAGSSGPQTIQNGEQRTFTLRFKIDPKPIQIIATQTVQPTYGVLPEKLPGKKSLIVVTHGWQPAWKPVDISWVDTMTTAINKYLVNQGLTEWQVETHRWIERSRPPVLLWVGGAEVALHNAKEEGVSLGRQIVYRGFSHVHLIAHSAGSGLIQSASETIKTLLPDTAVHLTFLDPFVGLNYEEKNNYGKGANWSDNYFSRDFETSGGIFPFTQSSLDYAYNTDVTWLDSHRDEIQVHSSTSLGDVSQTCYQKTTSHGWPYQFYVNTIPPNKMLGSEIFGFLLSKEGGNWNIATNQYRVGKNTLSILGKGEPSCVPNPSANSLHIELPTDFSKLPGASAIMSSPEHVIIHGIDFDLKTASPAWLAVTIPITNKINLISLEAQFKSASGAEGLLSVYWETSVVGSIDERMTSQAVRQYTFPIPETSTNGTRTVGFRLDAFSAIQSSVTITNVAFGFVGAKEPFSLSFASNNFGGLPLLQLTGPSNRIYRVETSENLVLWIPTKTLVNTTGIVRFVPSESTNTTARFYRAVAP